MKPWLTTVIGCLIGMHLAVNFGGPGLSFQRVSDLLFVAAAAIVNARIWRKPDAR